MLAGECASHGAREGRIGEYLQLLAAMRSFDGLAGKEFVWKASVAATLTKLRRETGFKMQGRLLGTRARKTNVRNTTGND